MKEDAEEALQVWENGSDISPPRSEDVVTFFIIASTQIEELSSRALYIHGHKTILQNIVNQKRDNPPKLSTSSLDDFRDVHQYERELALEQADIVSEEGKRFLEHTRWVRNQIAHSRDGAVRAGDLRSKFVRFNREFSPTKIPQQTTCAIKEIESVL